MKKIISILVAAGALIVFSNSLVLASEAPKAFKKCKACHKTNADNSKWTVGPGLKGIGKRTSADFLDKWLKDPQGTFDAGGPEIEALKKGAKFKAKLKMPTAVKKLSDEDRKALVGYLMAL